MILEVLLASRLSSVEETNTSLYVIATEESLEQSMHFVNERYLLFFSIIHRLESMGFGSTLKFNSSESEDVVAVLFAYICLS